MSRSQVVIAGRINPAGLLDDIAHALLALGHQVHSYPDADALHRDITHLSGANVLIACPQLHCSRQILASAPHLRGIVSPVIGIERIDTLAATDLGVIVANGHTRENWESMAEATILLILAALYDLRSSEAHLRDNSNRPAGTTARMFSGKTIGMIGFCQIARAIAIRLTGWGVRILVYSRRVHADAPNTVNWVNLEELLQTSDVVCVLASLNADTERLLCWSTRHEARSLMNLHSVK